MSDASDREEELLVIIEKLVDEIDELEWTIQNLSDERDHIEVTIAEAREIVNGKHVKLESARREIEALLDLKKMSPLAKRDTSPIAF